MNERRKETRFLISNMMSFLPSERSGRLEMCGFTARKHSITKTISMDGQ